MKHNIVLIEDDKVTALNLKIQIDKLGYEVSGVFHTAADALENLEHTPADLYLIDISLQTDADGLDVAKTLKEKSSKPFIFLTAHSDKEIVSKAKELSPAGYIVKPFHPNSLKASIESALTSNTTAKDATPASLPKEAVKQRLALLSSENKIPFGKLYHYDKQLDTFFKNNTPLELEEEQKELLKLLLANLGVVLTHEDIQNYFKETHNTTIKTGRVVMRLKMILGSEVIKNAEGIGYHIQE